MDVKGLELKGFKLLGKRFKLPLVEEDDVDLAEIVRPKLSNLSQQAEELPGWLLWIGVLQAKAEKNAKLAETEYKIWQATRYKKIRTIKEKLKKKATEAEIMSAVRRNPEYLEMKKKQFEAEEVASTMRAAYWALQKKAEIVAEMLKKESNHNKLSHVKLQRG